jgi:hypothetical protein
MKAIAIEGVVRKLMKKSPRFRPRLSITAKANQVSNSKHQVSLYWTSEKNNKP